MHLFDSDDPRKTQASFYVSTVLIFLITYALAGLAVWWMGNLDQHIGRNKLAGAAGFGRYRRTESGSGRGDGPPDESLPSHSPPGDSSTHGNFGLLKNLRNLRIRKQQKRDVQAA